MKQTRQTLTTPRGKRISPAADAQRAGVMKRPQPARVMIVTRIDSVSYSWWQITARAQGWRSTWTTRDRAQLLRYVASWYGTVKLRRRVMGPD